MVVCHAIRNKRSKGYLGTTGGGGQVTLVVSHTITMETVNALNAYKTYGEGY